MTTIETTDHAQQNAAAWVADIADLLQKLANDPDREDSQRDAASIEEELRDMPLSVQVRSGWADPGTEFEAEEFEILLTTGGPALRIRGELDEAKQPSRAWLEYQDWGTPWTQYFQVEQSTLLAFAGYFYYGE